MSCEATVTGADVVLRLEDGGEGGEEEVHVAVHDTLVQAQGVDGGAVEEEAKM
jgi:hypothetical protein